MMNRQIGVSLSQLPPGDSCVVLCYRCAWCEPGVFCFVLRMLRDKHLRTNGTGRVIARKGHLPLLKEEYHNRAAPSEV